MSLQPAEVQKHLRHLLDEEARLLQELEKLLQRESEVVGGSDMAAIASIGTARQGCVDTLTRLDNERADTCRMLSFGKGRGAILKLFAWADSSGQLTKQWHANLEVAKRCKKINDTNGAVVTAKLSRVEKLLMALRGTSAPPVYGARGSRKVSLGSRDFGRA